MNNEHAVIIFPAMLLRTYYYGWSMEHNNGMILAFCGITFISFFFGAVIVCSLEKKKPKQKLAIFIPGGELLYGTDGDGRRKF